MECSQNRVDCFANEEKNKCRILGNTKFKKPCPFYKTLEQYEAGKKNMEV